MANDQCSVGWLGVFSGTAQFSYLAFLQELEELAQLLFLIHYLCKIIVQLLKYETSKL